MLCCGLDKAVCRYLCPWPLGCPVLVALAALCPDEFGTYGSHQAGDEDERCLTGARAAMQPSWCFALSLVCCHVVEVSSKEAN